MKNLNSSAFMDNGIYPSFQINVFKKNRLQPRFLDESILNDSFSDNSETIRFFADKDNLTNNQIELNYMAPLIENNPLDKIYPFIGKETASEFREDSAIYLLSTHSKSRSNIFQDTMFGEKREKIFEIRKDNKKIGRIKKNTIYVGKHNRFCEDNIIRKIKGRFLEKCRIAINNEYKKYLFNNNNNLKKENDLLQRITPKVSRKIKRDENLSWLRSKMYQVFSEKVSVKCTLYESDYNKNNIQKCT